MFKTTIDGKLVYVNFAHFTNGLQGKKVRNITSATFKNPDYTVIGTVSVTYNPKDKDFLKFSRDTGKGIALSRLMKNLGLTREQVRIIAADYKKARRALGKGKIG